jgi:hypothetical protein
MVANYFVISMSSLLSEVIDNISKRSFSTKPKRAYVSSVSLTRTYGEVMIRVPNIL